MRGNCRNTDACRQRGREIASAHGEMDPQQLCRKQAHEVMSLSIEQELLGEREESESLGRRDRGKRRLGRGEE
jgi:hypothetical protein